MKICRQWSGCARCGDSSGGTGIGVEWRVDGGHMTHVVHVQRIWNSIVGVAHSRSGISRYGC